MLLAEKWSHHAGERQTSLNVVPKTSVRHPNGATARRWDGAGSFQTESTYN